MGFWFGGAVMLLCACVTQAGGQVITLPFQSDWKYFKGTQEASNPVSAWRGPAFDDIGWSTGQAPFRYGDGTGGTSLNDMMNQYTSVYLRRDFHIDHADSVEQVYLSVDYDDGFIIWINGVWVESDLAPLMPTYDATATNFRESGTPTNYTYSASEANLVDGDNTIAVMVFNFSLMSSDIFFDAELSVKKQPPPLPLLPDTVFTSHPSGFYDASFTLQVSAGNSGDTVKYTFDGSDPRSSGTAITAVSPFNVFIDPYGAQGGRGQTPAVVFRACKIKNGYNPGYPTTRTIIFKHEVGHQGADPESLWPNPYKGSYAQNIDYEMDPNIVFDPNYRDSIVPALLDIPTISMVTDNAHLFGSSTGIYMNADQNGPLWERPTSIELIYPNQLQGVEAICGVSIRGGYSSTDRNPKHAFHLEFSKVYGPGTLKYPLFGDEGPGKFDKFDLRTSQNYSWSFSDRYVNIYNTMNREVFSRDLQREMGELYTRSRYYHLYINGAYWGLFQTQEKVSGYYGATYLGGAKEDYDVIKPDRYIGFVLRAVDGTLDNWEEVWSRTQRGFSSNSDFFALQGEDDAGKRDTALTKWVDMGSLIDFMLIVFYGGNFDSPVSKFLADDEPNNFFLLYKKNGKKGFRFLIHDAEHSLLADPVNPGIGLLENRVEIGSTGAMECNSFSKFHPQCLHQALTENLEYRMQFAQHVYKYMFGNGIMTPAKAIRLFQDRASEIQKAIIAESARWGDTQGVVRTKEDWKWAVNQVVNDYLPYRNDIVIQQLKDEGLYPDIDPPVLKHNNTIIFDEAVAGYSGYLVNFVNPNQNGTMYYTTNGSDPRLVGGGISGEALIMAQNGSLQVGHSMVVNARVKEGSTWSAMKELVFVILDNYTNLKITEIHYHPLDYDTTLGGKQLEFIELKNTGDAPIDLTGLAFTEGIDYAFPANTFIYPDSFIVIASNDSGFHVRYGFYPFGVYEGSLNNGGEDILLSYYGFDTIIYINFSDTLPWPVTPDGEGPSLVPVDFNPVRNQNDAAEWRASYFMHGSPGQDDLLNQLPEPALEKPLVFNIYPLPASSMLTIRCSERPAKPVKAVLVDMKGRVCWIAHMTEAVLQLDVQSLADGVYFLRLTNHRINITEKVIVCSK